MKVRKIAKSEVKKLIAFNKKNYPHRTNIEGRFDLLLSSPWLPKGGFYPVLVAVNKNNHIIGHFLNLPGKYWYDGKVFDMYWGFDIFVSEEYRDSVIGGILTVQSFRTFSPYFGAGFSKRGKEICIAARAVSMGALHGYLKPNLNLVSSILGRLRRKFTTKELPSRTSAPSEIVTKFRKFELINSAQELVDWQYYPFDKKIIDFDRSYEFLSWRFFSQDNRFLFYRSIENNSDIYFVAKPTLMRRKSIELYVISIIDYRISGVIDGEFLEIVKACEWLAKQLNAEAVWTASSNAMFDKVLRGAKFFRVGRPGLILTTMQSGEWTQQVSDRRSVIVTPADADIELSR